LGATGAQGASRFEIVGKSPMLVPEGFCYGNSGGYWGPALKRAGYDGVVISGKADQPVYLWICDGRAEILDASRMWGRGVNSVRDHLKQVHGKNTRFITTGVAGENLCRNANLMTDNEGSVTGGFGSVIGAKNLKAVAVSGTGNPMVAHPEELKDLNRLSVHLNQRDPMFNPYPEDQISRIGKASCYQCGLDCIMRNTFKTVSGKEVVRKCQSMFVYFPWVMARPGEPAETASNATDLCNDLSLCTMEVYNMVQWLVTAYEAGYLSDSQTGLEIDKLGTWEFFETLANMIAHRKGFGDILAEGLLRAGQTLGEDARAHFANEVSGVGDGATYSAREYLMNGLLYALEPRQPIAMHEKAWDLNTHEGKAMAATKIIDRTYLKDSLLLCDSCWPLMVSQNTEDKVGDPTLESRIFSAVTGIESDEKSLHQYGERIFNQQRAILLREGRRPKSDDTVAEFNFTDPVQSVFMNPDVIVPGPGDEVISRKGQTLDRDAFTAMRDEFYQLRGWDPETGLQTEETLNRIGLSDLAEDLKKKGLV
jgi:aldehyde:ferredoxin oxidoreductase